MLAALKGKLIDAVIFDRYDDDYPMWFVLDILDNTECDGFDNFVFGNPEETIVFTLEPGNTVALRNEHDQVMFTTKDIFEKNFVLLDQFKAALKEDCVRFTPNKGVIEIENTTGFIKKLKATDFLKRFEYPYIAMRRWYK